MTSSTTPITKHIIKVNVILFCFIYDRFIKNKNKIAAITPNIPPLERVRNNVIKENRRRIPNKNLNLTIPAILIIKGIVMTKNPAKILGLPNG
jgi:hypothetical protein